MQQAAAAPAPARRREYTAVDPRCEWARTVDADTLVVDVSGFRKEELKVLYNTSRKLKVTGERQIDADGERCARFLKTFPVSRSCDSRAIRAVMDKEEALLYVILPKRSPSSSSSSSPSWASIDKEKEQQPESSEPHGHGEQRGGTVSAGGSSSVHEELEARIGERKKEEQGETQEERQERVFAIQEDEARTDGPAGGDTNAVKNGDGQGNKNRWWKIRPLHVLGLVLILALVGVGACVLYVMLL